MGRNEAIIAFEAIFAFEAIIELAVITFMAVPNVVLLVGFFIQKGGEGPGYG